MADNHDDQGHAVAKTKRTVAGAKASTPGSRRKVRGSTSTSSSRRQSCERAMSMNHGKRNPSDQESHLAGNMAPGPLSTRASTHFGGVSAKKTNSKQSLGRHENIIAAGLRTYKYTNQYKQACATKFHSVTQLAKMNEWISQHEDDIEPEAARFCPECGDVNLLLCHHNLAVESVCEIEPPVENLRTVYRTNSWWPFTKSKFDFDKQNQRTLRGFKNSDIGDVMIIKQCYNYVTANMQTSYVYNGKYDRNLCLAHCQRLAMRWVELDSAGKERLMSDTTYKNRIMFTIQRACDNAENGILYAFTDPLQDFGLAWYLKSFLSWLVTSQLIRILVGLLMLLYVLSVYAEPVAVTKTPPQSIAQIGNEQSCQSDLVSCTSLTTHRSTTVKHPIANTVGISLLCKFCHWVIYHC